MSEHKTCTKCGDDLGWNGRGFGVNECCCNVGICIACCMDEKTEREAAH